ncbi:MAG: FKBP-type peptidyl-prolyl cis-trans isomerase [Bacteroidaceae bacterium]|nr:FKBP-type peptidyl-prolyl cis-trans isomerase [Bacteroidaceae bacterium]
MENLSYALGMIIGHNLKGMNIEGLNTQEFAQAVADVIDGKETRLGDMEAQTLVQKYMQEKEAEQSKALRAEGEAFLAENAKKDDVVVLPSGLQYTVLAEGNDTKPSATDNVKCHYEGRLINGTVFDSSYKRGEPAVFPLNGVIAGWTEGVQLMGEGAKYRFFIPYNLAYGERGAGQSIPPYAALIFDVELIEVMAD